MGRDGGQWRERGVGVALTLALALALSGPAVAGERPLVGRQKWARTVTTGYAANGKRRTLSPAQCAAVLARGRAMLTSGIRYEPAYVGLSYPGGDVPATTGVCADVIVRAFRAIGTDLQVGVHEDMRVAFAEYPNLWSLARTDRSIDHRRVPNLMRYLARRHVVLPLSKEAGDYSACDVVAWDLSEGVTHVGLVTDWTEGGEPLVLHHIGGAPAEERVLFQWRLLGHYAL
jgi:hypothetical protein